MAAALQVLHLHPGLGECLGIGVALVAERIELGGDHHGGRQAGEALREER